MAYQLTVLLTLAVDLGSSPRTYLRGSSQLPIAPAPQHRTQSAGVVLCHIQAGFNKSASPGQPHLAFEVFGFSTSVVSLVGLSLR